VKHLFTLSGGHISPILCASEKQGIRIIDVRHEVNAVFAADAVARLSGTIGVAAVTAGPGLTNTITAIKNAQMAESPILLLGGAAANLLKGRGALQDIDQMSLFKSLCKYTATIRYVRDIPRTLREAIRIAQSGTPGPVFVEFPIDTLYPIHLVQRELGVKEGATNLAQKLVNMYLNNYLQSLFAGAFDKHEYTPLKVDIPLASQSQVAQAVELLKNAKRPVILLGSQATLPPMPAEKLREALEKMNAPCFLGGMARGLLGKDSEIQFKHCRKEALKEADVVVLAGTVADFRLGYGKVLSKKSKIITINRSKEQLTKVIYFLVLISNWCPYVPEIIHYPLIFV
jgi:acetolactate synthase-like protein